MTIRCISAILFAATIVFAEGAAASADEVDAVINDPSRSFTKTKRKTTPDQFTYGRLKLDSKGRVVSMAYMTGTVTQSTKVVMGKLDEKTMKWTDGEPIEGGVESELFTTKGKVLRVAVFIDDDKKIERIVVKNTDEQLEKADSEFDAVLKEIGRTEGLGTSIAYVRQELDAQWKVVKKFGITISFVHKDAKIAMGKFNAETKKWEAGEVLENGLANEIFKDLGTKNLEVWMVPRDDKRGFAALLVKPAEK